MIKKTTYTVPTDKFQVGRNSLTQTLKIAQVSDLHGASFEGILPMLKDVDIIAVTGDLIDSVDFRYDWKYRQREGRGYEFLTAAAKIAPTYYSLGNHEGYATKEFKRRVKGTGAVLLDNRMVEFGDRRRVDDMAIADHKGVDDKRIHVDNMATTAHKSVDDKPKLLIAGLSTINPNLQMLTRFSSQPGYKVLLCHNPEYYPRYIHDLDIDLILSGHAHGGQIQVFRRGLYAPGQGLFPKFTHGVHDGRLVVSRGATNTVWMPRVMNACEVVVVEIGGANYYSR